VSKVLSVNLARVRANPDAPSRQTGIDKSATLEAVMVRSPGPMRSGLGSGLVGDTIGNQKLHGGDDQAVYAYAREDLDGWEAELDRPLANGVFGENLTLLGLDVNGALIGERWRVEPDVVLDAGEPGTYGWGPISALRTRRTTRSNRAWGSSTEVAGNCPARAAARCGWRPLRTALAR
jgi:MOSC domain-containing protein YiiM